MKRIRGYRAIGYKLEGDADNDAEGQNPASSAGTTEMGLQATKKPLWINL
jgi:hypothetical protein